MTLIVLRSADYVTKQEKLEGEDRIRATGTAVVSGDNIRRLFAMKNSDADHEIVIICKEGSVVDPEWSWLGKELSTLSNLPKNPDGPGLDPDYTIGVHFDGLIAL